MRSRHQAAQRRLGIRKHRPDTAINDMTQGLLLFDASARLFVCNARSVEMYKRTAWKPKSSATSFAGSNCTRRQAICSVRLCRSIGWPICCWPRALPPRPDCQSKAEAREPGRWANHDFEIITFEQAADARGSPPKRWPRHAGTLFHGGWAG